MIRKHGYGNVYLWKRIDAAKGQNTMLPMNIQKHSKSKCCVFADRIELFSAHQNKRSVWHYLTLNKDISANYYSHCLPTAVPFCIVVHFYDNMNSI